jgi:hypothetical protein
MKKFPLIVGALMAVCAFGVLTAASASAAFLLAECLLNGVAITSNDLVEISGELLLEDTGAPAKPDVLCSGIFDGWVGPNSLDWVSEVLNLSKEAISTTPLSGLALLCTLDVRSSCEASTETIDVYPVGLPWETEVELLEQTGGPFFIVLFFKAGGGKFGWETTNCLVFGVPATDECTTEQGAASLTLSGTTLVGHFSTEITELAGLTKANCTASSTEHTGVVEGEGNFIVSGGGELSASSEKVEA